MRRLIRWYFACFIATSCVHAGSAHILVKYGNFRVARQYLESNALGKKIEEQLDEITRIGKDSKTLLDLVANYREENGDEDNEGSEFLLWLLEHIDWLSQELRMKNRGYAK